MATEAANHASQSPALIVESMARRSAPAAIYRPVDPAAYGPIEPSLPLRLDQRPSIALVPSDIPFQEMQGSSSGSSSGSGCDCPANPVWEMGVQPTSDPSVTIGTERVEDWSSYYVERTTTVQYRGVEFGSGVVAAAGGNEIVANVERWRSETTEVTVTAGINPEVIDLALISSSTSSFGTKASASVTIGGDSCYEERATGIQQVAYVMWVEVYHAKPGHTVTWTNPVRDQGETLLGYSGPLAVRVDKKCTG